ncbi:hypothetical protein K431DRAFT_289042 [Polychaeton citri CBS 116435]|uniref:Myb/SANT-like domain-containing protein n=1 Tax=Polychaeton citri CBS 116435 TaxID=1314669 RepID=A0A9P4UIH8_9PEZI|nr:hypothetical protein K431DRAFT_289042 [Polychaeton citri CBS 116435]
MDSELQILQWSATPVRRPVTLAVDGTSVDPALCDKPNRATLFWNNEMEEELIRAMVDAVNAGMRAQSGYKSQAWRSAVERVKAVTPAKRIDLLDVSKIKSKMDSLRQDWRAWNELLSQSGFNQDPETNMVTGDLQALQEYWRSHPKARKFKYEPLRLAAELDVLFRDVVATGEQAKTVDQLLREQDSQNLTESALAALDEDPSSSNTERRLNLRRKAGDLESRFSKRSKGAVRVGEGLDRITPLLVESNELMGVVQRASKLLWEGFADIGFDNKLKAAEAIAKGNNAHMFVSAPIEAQKRFVQQWIDRADALERLTFNGTV